MQIINKDKLFAEGVKSPIDGNTYTTRAAWNIHLKDNGCVEVGNDWNKSVPVKKTIEGDFNNRSDISRSIQELRSKGVL